MAWGREGLAGPCRGEDGPPPCDIRLSMLKEEKAEPLADFGGRGEAAIGCGDKGEGR